MFQFVRRIDGAPIAQINATVFMVGAVERLAFATANRAGMAPGDENTQLHCTHGVGNL